MVRTPQIRFCETSDGVRIAYATTGHGPALIGVATWLNHLEFDWQSPVWRPRLLEMTKNYTMTRYDGRGCGLSDRSIKDLSFDANLRDLEAVADAAGFERFVLLGCCQGSGLAIAYAARHPERVSSLARRPQRSQPSQSRSLMYPYFLDRRSESIPSGCSKLQPPASPSLRLCCSPAQTSRAQRVSPRC